MSCSSENLLFLMGLTASTFVIVFIFLVDGVGISSISPLLPG